MEYIVLETRTKGEMVTTIKEVIDLVNKARKALGKEEVYGLPKGVRGRAWYCPLARALKAESVGGKYAHFKTDLDAKKVADAWSVRRSWGATVKLPDALAEFVAKFDSGLYLEYELESELQ